MSTTQAVEVPSDEKSHFNVRWAIKRDMPTILAIEQACFARPWRDADFWREMHRQNTIMIVIEDQDAVIGFMVIEMNKDNICIINLAINPTHQRRGAGKQLVKKAKNKLLRRRREGVVVEVSKNNNSAKSFFEATGFVPLPPPAISTQWVVESFSADTFGNSSNLYPPEFSETITYEFSIASLEQEEVLS